MKYRKLGRSGLDVSLIGLGTMTWGEQNTEAEAHEQLDYALARGINLIDTAEMYPVPPLAQTQGLTETYIGTWLASRKRRQDLVLASKVAGPVRDPKRPGHIRDGKTFLDRKNLTAALDASLKRLRTDYLDLYQLHWPDRTTATFGKLAYPWTEGEQTVAIEETLSVLQDFVREGKVRHVGVSTKRPGAWRSSSSTPRTRGCRASCPSRMPTACSTACSRAACRNSRATKTWACWPIRRWPWACSVASTWTAPGQRARA